MKKRWKGASSLPREDNTREKRREATSNQRTREKIYISRRK